MTTYRLPDGAEIASLDVNGGPSPDKAWVTHPTLGSILIDRDKLTQVKPPLPPEPPVGTVFSTVVTTVPCCDLHNVHCEPPSELCCEHCTEVRHPEHGPGVVCVLEAAAERGGS